MIILGIDPGYGTIGYGVVRFDNMKLFVGKFIMTMNRG